MQWEKIYELDMQILGHEEDMCKHASEMREVKDSHSEELKQVQRRHEDEVAELKSQLVLLQQEADKARQAAQQAEVSRQTCVANHRVASVAWSAHVARHQHKTM